MWPKQDPRQPLQKPNDLVAANRMGAFVNQDVSQFRPAQDS
ncbi:MAG: hypothetical protein ABSG53_27825 [Thermoguttaceae bacterium]